MRGAQNLLLERNMAYHGVTWHSCLFSDNPSRCPLPCRPFPVCTHCGRRSLLLVTLVPYLYFLTQIPCPTLALRVAGYLFCFSHEVMWASPLHVDFPCHCSAIGDPSFCALCKVSINNQIFRPHLALCCQVSILSFTSSADSLTAHSAWKWFPPL